MGTSIAARTGRTKFKTELVFENHNLIADEPLVLGGEDLGPTPLTMLKMSLGACTAITLRMYADRKEWNLDEVNVIIDFESDGKSTRFTSKVELIGDLDDTQRARLMQVASKCPVHKVLANPIEIETIEVRNS
jgi:putative redox protein